MISCSNDDAEIDTSPYAIVLIAGQSNTNSGLGLDPVLDSKYKGIMQLGRFRKRNFRIIEAEEPLDHHTKQGDKIGFALTFAKLLKQHFNEERNILLIPCGFKGTGFSDHRWNRGDDLYNDAINRVKTIQSRNPESELVSILWHQGERDVGNSDYEKNLDQFIGDIRKDLEAEQVPFILAGMVPYWVEKENQRIAQQTILEQTTQRHHLVGYVDPNFPFKIEKVDNSFDEIHFSANGQRELGKRYFEEFLKLTGQQTK